ncbi:MAG: sensor histidine kinase [Wujia sp.]
MIINEIIPSILEFITFYLVTHFFLAETMKPKKKDLIFIFCIVFVSVWGHNHPTASWIFGVVLYLLYSLCVSSGNLIDRLLLYCLSYTSIVLFQLMVVFFVALADISYDERYMALIGSVMSIVITFLAVRFTPYRHLYTTLKNTAFLYKILLINSYLVLAIILLFMKDKTIQFYQNLSFFITVTAVLFIFNLYVLYYEQHLQMERQKAISYQENLPIYKALIDEIRSNQHEFNNRIQSLGQLPLTCKDYESLCREISKNTNQYKLPSRSYALLQLNMPLLSATLYNLYTKANEQGIHIIFDIASTNIQSHAPEYLLADFASIVTENAIEACKEGDNIYVQISSKNNYLHFEVRNPSENLYTIEEINNFFKKGYSTKEQNTKTQHGLGLYYLTKELMQYDGSISADCAGYDNQNWIIVTFCV